jgi:putative AdoMet-dependent methyltransferase
MTPFPPWQYDERKCSGVDFTSIEEVAAYDEMHSKIRNYARGTEEIVRRLDLGPDSTVIDLGCGTGAFALHAAGKVRTIYAVDISETMLAYCRQQAERKGITNIVFARGGLLTYEHTGEPADAIVCVAVLHHLPDLWKQVALKRCCDMLRPGGRFLLFDIVFPSDTDDLSRAIDTWIASIDQAAGHRLAEEAVIHVRDEFSTYDWILEGMIGQAGFRIDASEYSNGVQGTFVCTKKG